MAMTESEEPDPGVGGIWTAESIQLAEAFPLIADYGFLSDCEVAALVAPSGGVEWLCLPRFDSPSVFGAILDRQAGIFRLSPVDAIVPASRRYLPGTMVLETTWQTATGWLVVLDTLCIDAWDDDERSSLHLRMPRDHRAVHVLLRHFRCVQGSVEVKMICQPAFNYGQAGGLWSYTGSGYRAARVQAALEDSSTAEAAAGLELDTSLRLGFEGSAALADTTLREGQAGYVALGWSATAPPASLDEADRLVDQTSRYWRNWVGRGVFPDHPWREHLQRSALTLKGLTYAPSGAMIAAATTSLPETPPEVDPNGGRNWDYRYSWVRDSTFMLWALYTLGFQEEADDFFYFVADQCEEDAPLQLMYGVGGEAELPERIVENLSGYRLARPVRSGNEAYAQVQLDVWGAFVDSVWLHTKSRDHLSDRVWHAVSAQVEAAIDHWRNPDQGIWEMRGPARHFTSSKVMCWVAADRGRRLAELRGDSERAKHWSAQAAEIHADVCTQGVRADGAFAQSYGSEALDASLLLIPLVRFLPAQDSRVVRTVLAIADELTDDGLVVRYRVDESQDGLGSHEATFAICSFWLVSALVEIDQADLARPLCERLLALASPLSLYGEELDAKSGRHYGNFPQAFTHLALINAVTHLIRVDERKRPNRFEPAHAGRTGL